MNKKIRENYESIAQKTGLHLDAEEGAFYGQRSSYSFIVYPANPNAPYTLTVTISAKRAAGTLSKDVCKQFKRENKPVTALSQTGSLVVMTLRNYSSLDSMQENLNASINALVNLLHREGFENSCQSCGSKEPFPCNISGSYMHLCSNCFAQLQHSSSISSSKELTKKENVIGGIVGGLLGSLLGVLSIIIFSQLGYVAALSGVIMAICTLKGYEMLGGKLSKKGIAISVVLMIVMTLFGDRLDWAIIISQELEVDLATAFRIFPELIHEEIIEMGDYIANLVMQYLFVVLGAVPTIMNTLKNKKNEGRIHRLGGSAAVHCVEE